MKTIYELTIEQEGSSSEIDRVESNSILGAIASWTEQNDDTVCGIKVITKKKGE